MGRFQLVIASSTTRNVLKFYLIYYLFPLLNKIYELYMYKCETVFVRLKVSVQNFNACFVVKHRIAADADYSLINYQFCLLYFKRVLPHYLISPSTLVFN